MTHEPKVGELPALLNFLHGSAAYERVWFGERHPTRKGEFWWRSLLATAVADEREARKDEIDTALLNALDDVSSGTEMPLAIDGQWLVGGRSFDDVRSALRYALASPPPEARKDEARDAIKLMRTLVAHQEDHDAWSVERDITEIQRWLRNRDATIAALQAEQPEGS